MLLRVYTCIRYTPDPRAAVVHLYMYLHSNMSCYILILHGNHWGKKRKEDPQKSVAAMAATVPTPLMWCVMCMVEFTPTLASHLYVLIASLPIEIVAL